MKAIHIETLAIGLIVLASYANAALMLWRAVIGVPS